MVVGICTGCQSVFHEEESEDGNWRFGTIFAKAFKEHAQFDTPDGCPDDSEYYLEDLGPGGRWY